MAETTKDSPAAKGLAQQAAEAAVSLCRDVYAGTARLREKASVYLPAFPRERQTAYESRVGASVLYNAFRRTVHGLTGMVMRKPPAVGQDVPTPIVEAWENIDLAGRHGDVFAHALLLDAIVDGHAHIFVDKAVVNPDRVKTLADERDAGLRPYWVEIRKGDVLRSRTINVNGRTVLAGFAYLETSTEKSGMFGEVEVQRIRDYELVGGAVTFLVYRKRKDEADWSVEVADGRMDIDCIPLVTVYAQRTGVMTYDPP